MKKLLMLMVGVAFLAGLSGVGVAEPAASMYTLEGIYDYLMEGVVPIKGGHSLDPPSGAVPGDIRFNSLEEILDDIKAQFELTGASAEDVVEGVVFWSTDPLSWGLQTGEMPVYGDGLIATGQTERYSTGDDGYYQKGIPRSYTNNNDGTVTDNATGLMWASDGRGLGCDNRLKKNWEAAIDWAEGLTFAGYDDWRIPNLFELATLLRYNLDQGAAPYIDKTYFSNTDDLYNCSTSYPGNPANALSSVSFTSGILQSATKAYERYSRAVRGGD